MLEGKAIFQMYFYWLEKLADRNCKFNKSKYEVWHLERITPRSRTFWDWLVGERICRKKKLGSGGDIKESTQELQCTPAVKKAYCTLSCITKKVTSVSSEVIPPLYLELVKLYLKSCVQFWPPQCQRKSWHTEMSPLNDNMMTRSLEHK